MSKITCTSVCDLSAMIACKGERVDNNGPVLLSPQEPWMITMNIKLMGKHRQDFHRSSENTNGPATNGTLGWALDPL